MSEPTIIEGEVVEPTTELVAAPPTNLFAADPVDALHKAQEVAGALTDVLRKGQMIQAIQGKEYVKVEGWQTLGSMLGVSAVVVGTRELDNGFEATVEARTMDGRVIGRADARCTRDESMWAKRDPYALQGMAQTRATSRALRGPLGHVVKLAGFEATAAEEIPHDGAPLQSSEPDLQWDVLPPETRFTATCESAVWRNTKNGARLLVVARVKNVNGGKDAGEKIWVDPKRQEFTDAHKFIGLTDELLTIDTPPDGWNGREFDLMITLNGQWRNYTILPVAPAEVSP